MRLVVKLPKNKPPFIGICFMYEHEAEKMNDDLVDNYGNSTFKLVFEFMVPFTNIMLINEEHLLLRNYIHIAYDDREKLKVWLQLTQANPPKYFNFGHIVSTNDQHRLVKTYHKKKNFVLRIDSYQTLKLDELETKKVEVKEKTTLGDRISQNTTN